MKLRASRNAVITLSLEQRCSVRLLKKNCAIYERYIFSLLSSPPPPAPLRVKLLRAIVDSPRERRRGILVTILRSFALWLPSLGITVRIRDVTTRWVISGSPSAYHWRALILRLRNRLPLARGGTSLFYSPRVPSYRKTTDYRRNRPDIGLLSTMSSESLVLYANTSSRLRFCKTILFRMILELRRK